MSAFEDILQAIVAGGDPATLLPPSSRGEVLLQAVLNKIRTLEQNPGGAGVSDGIYELVDTITIGVGGETELLMDSEPDETPYRFTGLIVDFACQGYSEICDFTLSVLDGQVTLASIDLPSIVDVAIPSYARVAFFIRDGIWVAQYIERSAYRDSSGYVSESLAEMVLAAGHPTCKGLSVSCSPLIPENSVLKIYGVRVAT